MTLRKVLAHQAGLYPYLDHWKNTLNKKNKLDEKFYCYKVGDSIFCNKVSDDLFASKYVEDSVYKWSIESKLVEKDPITDEYPYRYSDIGYYFMMKITTNTELKTETMMVLQSSQSHQKCCLEIILSN